MGKVGEDDDELRFAIKRWIWPDDRWVLLLLLLLVTQQRDPVYDPAMANPPLVGG